MKVTAHRRLIAHGGPHVFVEDLAAPAVDVDDESHLRKSLRLRAGDALTAADGDGSWRACRFGEGRLLAPDGPIEWIAPPHHELTVAAALVKGSRPELIVQKLTEIGIDHVVLFHAERSVVRWDTGRVEKNTQRLARVAREAAMQSRRVRLPTVSVNAQKGVRFLTSSGGVPHEMHRERAAGAAAGEVVDTSPDVVAVRADLGGRLLDAGDRCVVIGPEGGWTESERVAAPDAVSLGPQVLRAETAAIAAGVLMAALRSSLDYPPDGA